MFENSSYIHQENNDGKEWFDLENTGTWTSHSLTGSVIELL